MNQPPVQRRTYVYRFWQAYAILGAPLFVVYTLDTLLHPFALDPTHSLAFHLFAGLIVAPLTVFLGVMCIRRAPDNVVGLLLIALAYGGAVSALRANFADPTLRVLLSNGHIVMYWLAFLLVPIYFPDGRISPHRFERLINGWVLLCTAILVGLATADKEISLGFAGDTTAMHVPNPFYIPGLEFVRNFGVPIIVLLIVYSIPSLVIRYRTGSKQERLQLRWLAAGFALIIGIAFSGDPLRKIFPAYADASGPISALLSYFVYPLAIAYAILRHRLYDIDIIIRRTLIYSILSAILGVVFFGGVTLTQAILRSATGQSSDVAVVISTLGIAALFNPVRRRVQAAIDRRFYRTKYDAQKTLEQFSAVMRDEVDAEKLKAALVSTIQETMQPKQIALWIRKEIE